MPTGTPHHGLTPPYSNIRVDAFYTPRDAEKALDPEFYLLTHTHSDHVQGLQSKSFGLPVYCSIDAKHMLLNYEPAKERVKYTQLRQKGRTRPYLHLECNMKSSTGMVGRRKLLRPVALNTREKFTTDLGKDIWITAIDANHCPGSVMYLIEGPKGAVLHTGDVRCEASFITSLRQNPHLRPYIATDTRLGGVDSTSRTKNESSRRLEAIYLDTACMLFPLEFPSKSTAVDGLIQMMTKYPSPTRFFLNSWTWGYEGMLLGVARAFNSKIHVDRYKFEIYSQLLDPVWRDILTMDPTESRFHACERWDRCEEVPHGLPDVVYVNPKDMGSTRWAVYVQDTMREIDSGRRPTTLRIALARHSGLPELQSLVGLFRPNRIVPCTVYPQLDGKDWAAVPYFFHDQLPQGAAERIWEEMHAQGVGKSLDPSFFDPYASPMDRLAALFPDLTLSVTDFMEAGPDHQSQIVEGLPEAPEMDFVVYLKEILGKSRYERHVPNNANDDDDASTDDEKGMEAYDEEVPPEDVRHPSSVKTPPRPPPMVLPPTPDDSPPRRKAPLPTLPDPPHNDSSTIPLLRACHADVVKSNTFKFTFPNPDEDVMYTDDSQDHCSDEVQDPVSPALSGPANLLQEPILSRFSADLMTTLGQMPCARTEVSPDAANSILDPELERDELFSDYPVSAAQPRQPRELKRHLAASRTRRTANVKAGSWAGSAAAASVPTLPPDMKAHRKIQKERESTLVSRLAKVFKPTEEHSLRIELAKQAERASKRRKLSKGH